MEGLWSKHPEEITLTDSKVTFWKTNRIILTELNWTRTVLTDSEVTFWKTNRIILIRLEG